VGLIGGQAGGLRFGLRLAFVTVTVSLPLFLFLVGVAVGQIRVASEASEQDRSGDQSDSQVHELTVPRT
jgi:hypothetical protein